MKTISVTITQAQYDFAKRNFLTLSKELQKAVTKIMMESSEEFER